MRWSCHFKQRVKKCLQCYFSSCKYVWILFLFYDEVSVVCQEDATLVRSRFLHHRAADTTWRRPSMWKKRKDGKCSFAVFIRPAECQQQRWSNTNGYKEVEQKWGGQTCLIQFKEPEDGRIANKYPKNIILLFNLQFIQLNMLSFYCLK